MKKEKHLFIIWEKALEMQKPILDDINRKFEVINVLNVTWNSEHFSNNLSRFYGQKLPDSSHKEKHCGKGTFTVVIVSDHNPIYRDIDIGNDRGYVSVNDNVYSCKQLYRSWTGGGHKVHATNDINEFKHDSYLLFGSTEVEELKLLPINYKEDLIGTLGWKDVNQFTSALNCYNNYVILRGDLDQNFLSGNEDIDLLTEDRTELAYFINAKKGGKAFSESRFTCNIKNNLTHIDISVVGDDSFDINWQKEMLNSPCHSSGNLTRLSEYLNYYANLYHDVVHKGKEIDSSVLLEIKEFLGKHRYGVVEPQDISLGYFPTLLSGKNKTLKRCFMELIVKFKFGIYYARKNLFRG